VVFTDGTDQAARRTLDEALKAVNSVDQNTSVYTIGLGNEIDENVLEKIGKDGYFQADDMNELIQTFEEVANTIVADLNSHYMLEYCSPKRKGLHELKIVIYREGKGCSLTTCFCADNFTGGCKVSSGN
jgi:uncharacterized protein YegL